MLLRQLRWTTLCLLSLGIVSAQEKGPTLARIQEKQADKAAPGEKATNLDGRNIDKPAIGFAPEPVPASRLNLGQCIAIGMERQPNIKAAKAICDAAAAGKQGLDDVGRIASLFSPDLPCRRLQAAKGLEAVQAEMELAEQETTYAIIRMYYTTVYAQEQLKLAKELVDQLDVYLVQVQAIVNSKEGLNKDINKATEDRLIIARSEAIIKRNKADAGTRQALAALREAMGLQPGEPLALVDEVLPEIQADINRKAILESAASRRPEVRLAGIGADVARIEIAAQWAHKFSKRVPTFAIGSDIHAIPVPQGSRGENYLPQALGPRMPAQMVGNRDTRVAQSRSHAEYADNMLEKTRNLVSLEAENAYLKFIEAYENVRDTKVASKRGRELIERLREASGTRLNEQLILTSEASYTLAAARYNESLLEQILALANLERIAAGGIRVNYPGR